jgi:flagellar biosynthesis GTPase FlhF
MELTNEQLSALSIGTLKGVLNQNHVNARLVLEKDDLVAKVKALIEAEHREREREAQYHAMEEEARNTPQVPQVPQTLQTNPQSEHVPTQAHEPILQQQEGHDQQPQSQEQQGEEQKPQERQESQQDRPAEASEVVFEGPEAVPATESSPHMDVDSHDDHAPPPAAAPPDTGSINASLRASVSLPTMKQPVSLPPEREGLCVVCQDETANIAIVDCGHLALCMGCSDIIMKTTRECPLCRTRIVTEQRLLRIFRT